MTYRFSGHESFPCRYAWLPKAVRALTDDPNAFASEDDAMVLLGIGKNMVRALRFWMVAMGIAAPRAEGGYSVTPFGLTLLGTQGFDPYLEDNRTLWLLHWRVSTLIEEESPLFAWDYLLNRWLRPELSRSEVMRAFRQEADRTDRPPSDVTLEQHFDMFLHTYIPTRGSKGEIREDNLDCPLIGLELLHKVGERQLEDVPNKREPIYAFRREAKPEITPELFLYCLDDFRKRRHRNELTLPFREAALGYGSPGMIFKLPEWDVRERLETVELLSNGRYKYQESAAVPQLFITNPNEGYDYLPDVYLSDK